MKITFPPSFFKSYVGIVIPPKWHPCWLGFYFPRKIYNSCSRPDLYFARPCGCEHLKTIYWWNLLLLSGIAGHYFQNFIIRVSSKYTHSPSLILCFLKKQCFFLFWPALFLQNSLQCKIDLRCGLVKSGK